MNHKMMSAAGCLLLLAAAMVPTVLGHDDLNYDTGGHRYPTTPTAHDEDGVNGKWYGPSGICVTFDGPVVSQPPLAPIDPDFSACAGVMLCDMEVLGDGTSPQEPDEIIVDGIHYNDGVPPEGPNSAPDGTFDDGGIGGACHTNHYDWDLYNTPGCEDAAARANNIAPLAAPMVGASCDWKTIEGGTPQSDILVFCILNAAISSDPLQIPGEVVECVLDFIECVTGPVPCDTDGTESCGSDSISDGINFGPGNGAVPYPYAPGADTPIGESFTDDGLDCDLLDPSTATMGAFIFDSVEIVVPNGLPTVNPAVQGAVWQV